MAMTNDRLEQIRNECRRMRGHNPAVPDIEYLHEQLNIARKDATAAHKALEESCKYIQIALNYGFGQDWTRATEPQYWLQKAQEGTA